MVYPFISENGVLLKDRTSLDLEAVKKIKSLFSYKEKHDFISLYITEGVPFAFKANPLIFEDLRIWLARHLGEEPKNITLTGSSRLGFSLDPDKLGSPYKENSDLDLIIVSNNLFESFKNDFKLFVYNIQNRLKERQRIDSLALKNIENISHTINLGFIDQFKLPPNRKYPTIYKTYDLMWHLLQRMKISRNCPRPGDASIRVYQNWSSCIKQLTRSFNSSFK